MKLIFVQFVLLYLVFCNVDALSKCAESNKSGIFARAVEKDAELLPFKEELGEILDAFQDGNTERVEELFKSLENVTIAEPEDSPHTNYAGKIIKYVVSVIQTVFLFQENVLICKG